jgi:hypothetical protein
MLSASLSVNPLETRWWWASRKRAMALATASTRVSVVLAIANSPLWRACRAGPLLCRDDQSVAMTSEPIALVAS